MKKTLIVALVWGLLLTLAVMVRSGRSAANAAAEVSRKATDSDRIAGLLDEMKTVDLARLTPLPAERFALPPAGVDVMRVRLEETYGVDGVGKDTVELTGWIAAKHDNARPAEGETEVKWGTAVVDTEFVGLELRGESKIFGPVLVHLDRDHRSLGQVGKLDLSFVEQIALDTAYRDLRASSAESSSTNPDAVSQPKGQRGTKADQAAITRVMRGVWSAISQKDAAALLKYYAPGSKTAKGGEEEVAKQFADIRSIKVIPNNNLRIKFIERFANVTATGRNVVVDGAGRKGTSRWSANVQLEKRDGQWLITQDRTSLNPTGPRAADIKAIGGHCLAKISVDVEMRDLHLTMKTKAPVKWYSEVETIPPVGYTASVSATPTSMISSGREVATLEHGTVKFREIVRRIALDGTDWSQSASNK
jgi:ketosteroid isomerase-like protein